MHEFFRCLITANSSSLKSYGNESYMDVEYATLKGPNEPHFDVSMKVQNQQKLNRDSLLTNILKKSDKSPREFECNVEDGVLVGREGATFYFIVVDENGKLRIWTPVTKEENSSLYRMKFDTLLQKVTNLEIIDEVITTEKLQNMAEENRIIEILEIANEWKVYPHYSLRLEKEYKIDNQYKTDYFYDKVSSTMLAIQERKIPPEYLDQYYEKISL